MSMSGDITKEKAVSLRSESVESSDVLDQEKTSGENAVKSKRSKTFTGCFTCRSRKIRCDLRKPYCKNCRKAGLMCAGYDIKLRWSQPLQFDSATGKISYQVKFKQGNASIAHTSEDDIKVNSEFFQRRHVGFVKWDSGLNFGPYETYEDIDRDLGVLNNPQDKEIEQETKVLGPFGVFKRTIKRKREIDDEGGLNKINKHNGSKRISKENAYISEPMEIDEAMSHDQLWLSNELRDDALLTAAALNGDTQFLDFMSNLSSGSVLEQNGAGKNTLSLGSLNVTANQNDFLNLVFHGNSSQAHNFGNLTNGNSVSLGSSLLNATGIPMSTILNSNEPSNLLVDTSRSRIYDHGYHDLHNQHYESNEDLEINLHASKKSDRPMQVLEEDQNGQVRMPPSIMCIVQSTLLTEPHIDLAIPNKSKSSNSPSSLKGLPSTALQVQPLTRYLLNYYVTQVADLMTVIPLTENPWKTIYFPRALMAIGELLALGKTSNAKNALLNALLAVSAFNLQSKFPKNSGSMKYYLNLGIGLRNQASLFIKRLLGSKTDTQSGIEHCIANEKYKDVLCAVMSMISVDLVWGTMQDTNFYIKWCERVIATKMKKKKKLSSKARILHRIFLSLKLIQDSTCLDLDNIRDDFYLTSGYGYDVNGDKYKLKDEAGIDGRGRIDYIVHNITAKENRGGKDASPLFVDKKLINTKKNDENFATDALYGLPNSLIILFSETVKLLRTKRYYEGIQKSVPRNFEQKVKALDSDLLKWKLDWKLYNNSVKNSIKIDNDCELDFLSPMHEATYHHILSFYHALSIYHKRFLKGESPIEVQDKVELTLHHLNSIQALIARDEAAIIPLFWQGFIAGCEAVSSDLQLGFKKWGADIAQYLGSYWGARQIMLEVWRRKRLNEPRDNWIYVIQDWEMNLMLD